MKKVMIIATLLAVLISGLSIGASVATDESSKPKWTELSYKNFEETIQAHDYTCVLFYDPVVDDPAILQEHTKLLEGLMDMKQQNQDEGAKASLGFARLNGRHHSMYQRIYRVEHTLKPDDLDLVKELRETLLDASVEAQRYWPNQLLLLAPDYNLYNRMDLSTLVGDHQEKLTTLELWLQMNHKSTGESLDASKLNDDEGANNEPISHTPYYKEMEWKALYDKHGDNSFNFEAYKAAKTNTKEDNPSPRNVAIVLETDAVDVADDENTSPFVYDLVGIRNFWPSKEYLAKLIILIDDYLGWVEGYERLWSKDRKEKEDAEIAMGAKIGKMNKKIVGLLSRLFNSTMTPLDSPVMQKLDPETMEWLLEQEDLDKRVQVPNLKEFFFEMVFRSGRSVIRWQMIMDSMKSELGETPEERRNNRYKFDSNIYRVVPRLREFIAVQLEVGEDDSLYNIFLAELYMGWFNIMADFQLDLTKHYYIWSKKNPRPNGNEFHLQKMDIIDMKDPNNFEMLSNYTAFSMNYTKPGVPVVLSNVEFTSEPIDMDYIVKTCSASNVTMSVTTSYKVGEQQGGSGWGGLRDYKLDEELMTDSRRKDQNDKSLTLKQFVILTEHLEHLYLHDYALPAYCENMLFEGTPYSGKQKMKIPSVVGGWDMLQRGGRLSNSWPSLFIGKKGTNSKLHVDSGATGFFMYLVSGRKRWVIYKRDERLFLYKKMDGSGMHADILGMGKDKESNDFLSARFPLLHRASEGGYEIIQEPGQLVYIPPNCPHAVENLEDTIGLSMNFVPREGLANHLHWSTMFKQSDWQFIPIFQQHVNYWLFEDNAEEPVATEDPLYTTFGEYKSQF